MRAEAAPAWLAVRKSGAVLITTRLPVAVAGATLEVTSTGDRWKLHSGMAVTLLEVDSPIPQPILAAVLAKGRISVLCVPTQSEVDSGHTVKRAELPVRLTRDPTTGSGT